jgi:hypothetical protein
MYSSFGMERKLALRGPVCDGKIGKRPIIWELPDISQTICTEIPPRNSRDLVVDGTITTKETVFIRSG